MFDELLKFFRPGPGIPKGERRDTIRLKCAISALLVTKKMSREAKVINASLTGMALEVESKIRRKTKVTIKREEHGGPVYGTIIWCRAIKGNKRFQIGVSYDDDKNMLKASWLKPALKEIGFSIGRIQEQRQLARVPGHHRRCFLKSLDGDTYSMGQVLNLSLGGASVDSEVEIPKNLNLILKIDSLEDAPELLANAILKSCYRNPKTRKYVCGLEFTEPDEKSLRKHIAALMQDC